MMIHKIVLSLIGQPIKVEIPIGAEIISVHSQGRNVCLWYKFTLATKETRTFQVYGTGWDIPNHLTYIGTAHFEEDSFVWHVLEGE